MSIREVRLPDIGEGVTEAEIVEWQVAEGDVVEEDQIIGSVMTDKAAVEIPSPVGGVIVSLGGEIGEVLAVGALLARIDADESVRDGASGVDESVTDEASGADAAVDQAQVDGEDGDDDRMDEPVGHETDAKVLAAPAVRRRARDRSVRLHDVPASGEGGRVTHADLDRYLFDARLNATSAALPTETVEEVRVLGLRRQIARQMELASRRIPHFSYIEEIDATELEALRRSLASSIGKEAGKLSPLPFIVMAIVRSLDMFPGMNAHHDDDAGIVQRHGARHVGIATQTSAGLMVPVVHHAERLDIRELAAEIGRLVEAARDGHITREELTGSTITVTSLGALGGVASTPIINYPEVAIIGVNRIALRPVCRGEQIVTRQMMNLSSSFDHRVVDGHEAARFVQCIRGYIECPATLFLSD